MIPPFFIDNMPDLRAKYDVQAQPMHQYESFEASHVGHGPFVVRRQELVDEIIHKANPHRSVVAEALERLHCCTRLVVSL